jgi:hypothetical protein
MTVELHSCENPFPQLLQDMFSQYYNYNGPLDEIHTLLDSSFLSNEEKEYHKQLHGWSKDRNSIFVRKFHEYVDKHTHFNEAYYAFLRKYVLPRFPNESKLVIQKTPNIRFSLPDTAAIGFDPKDPENIVGLHCDRHFGHHPTEQNFIIPMTNMFESNSIYHEPFPNSGVHPYEFDNLVINTDQFVQAYFNQILHCNHINQTNKTRISFDIRIIPYSQYQAHLEDFQGTKFELGKYYIVL